ncbi:MAG: hypothetical protein IJQ32_04235 [Paludibacteraceae bacterium]|nr:hypothetical protein [Paludibacteraceae bacterium]
MKYLLILLTLMTFTVKDKNSVMADGQWPYDMDASYSCSYQKGTVRAGDVATLTVTGLSGITVEKVEVYVRSNKTEGAGQFTIGVNGNTVASKSGSLKDWTGAYDAENYHAISVLNKACSEVQTLTVTLTGIVNSLYIEKYVISYGMYSARTVTLMYQNNVFVTLKEEAGGQGVTMPTGPEVEGWWFVGWSKQGCENIEPEAELIRSNKKFYPSEDCTLWAIYKYIAEDEMVYESELRSGDYLYINQTLNIALTGIPSKGRMAYAPTDLFDPAQVYTIDFQGTDTAYITHAQTGTPIGYEGTELALKRSPWLVYREGVQTLFYTIVNTKKYVLWHHIPDLRTHEYYAGLFQADELSGAPVALCMPGVEKDPVYSCYPEGEMGLDQVEGERIKVKGEWVFPFGPYDLMIENGKKYLILR